MNLKFSFTADKAGAEQALAVQKKLAPEPLPAPLTDLIAFGLNALPDDWQAAVDCSASLSLDPLAPGPSTVVVRITPAKK